MPIAGQVVDAMTVEHADHENQSHQTGAAQSRRQLRSCSRTGASVQQIAAEDLRTGSVTAEFGLSKFWPILSRRGLVRDHTWPIHFRPELVCFSAVAFVGPNPDLANLNLEPR